MANYLSPGVYVSEADYSEYVADSSTCVVGIVGAAKRGPVGIPTLVTTQEQMTRIFGTPVSGEYGVYGALAALTRASQVYYTRVVRSGKKASAGVVGTDKIIYRAKVVGSDSDGIVITQSALAEEGGTFTLTIKGKTGTTLETHEGLTLTPTDAKFVETVLNAESEYVTADVQATGSYSAKTLTLGSTDETKGQDGPKYATAGVIGTDKITFRSKNYDSDINGCTVTLSEQDGYGFFDVTVEDPSDDSIVEVWESVSLSESSSRFIESIINKNSERIVCAVNSSDSIAYASKVLTFNGGDDGIDGVSSDDVIGQVTGSGLYSFSNPETVSVDIIITPGFTDRTVITEALAICENRGDSFYICDTPFGMSAQEVINWSNATGSFAETGVSGLNSSYGAVYWPWVKVSDSYSKKDIWLPPSGFVAAQYAYTDEVAFPWVAPAGIERGRITKAIGTEISPTKGERDAVQGNRNVINPIVNFLSNGIIIWGQKTMQREPTALDRVNVRRLLNYLKRTIGNTTRQFVFEQNNESTWERWTTTVEPLLTMVKQNGGVYEYKISINPTDLDIENNRMPINVYIKPTKTAEFIPLTFNIMQYSASFDEL